MDAINDQSTIVRFSPPSVGDDEIDAVVETLKSEWLTTGPKTAQFEDRFGEYLGAPAALAISSCTAGLHLALLAHGIGSGDEVITSTLTFTSTVNVIEHVGARPVLVDVEPDSLNLDPHRVEQAITPKSKAIIVVHFAGLPADMDALNAIAEANGLVIIEDAAHALPATYRGAIVGSSKRLTAFSFYATKNLTTGEGGMLTGAPELIERARALSLHGMSRNAWNRYDTAGTWFYDVIAPGFKYNMTDLQAALGLVQLRRLEELQRRRGSIFAQYNSAFGNSPRLEIPAVRREVKSAQHLYVLRLRGGATSATRDSLIATLRARAICTSVHFIPIHLHSYYREKYGYQPNDFPIAFQNFQRMLSLPLAPALTDGEVSRVIDAVYACLDSQAVRRAG